MTIRFAVGVAGLLCLGLAAHANAQQGDPAAVAAAWRRVSDTPAELADIRTRSLQLRDARIADAALATASNAERPTGVRLAALQILVTYVDPELTVSMSQLRHPSTVEAIAANPEPGGVQGSQIPSADLPVRIGSAVRTLGENDPDVVVRDAARFLTRELIEVRPGVITLAPASVTLVSLGAVPLGHICGTRYRITNHTDVDLSVRLITTRDVLKRSLRIPAGAAREVTVTEGGPARLLVGGAEIARSESGAACR